MRPMDAQNMLPEVATDQFALDRTLKHCASCAGSAEKAKLRKFSPCWT
jgi:hypothetical protein